MKTRCLSAFICVHRRLINDSFTASDGCGSDWQADPEGCPTNAQSRALCHRLLSRRLKTCLGAGHGEEGGARIDAEGGIQPLFLGAAQCRLGALHVDFLGALGTIGQYANMVVEHLEESLMHGEKSLL